MADTLYKRLGGYDAIAALCEDLLPRLVADHQLGRFWKNRSEDSIRRERQLLVDFLAASSGGPVTYLGRAMKPAHYGMEISEGDWRIFLGHLDASFRKLHVAPAARAAVLRFVNSTKADIVEGREVARARAAH
jgi:hemoglobin